MGPRSDEHGNTVNGGLPARESVASMGPRSDEHGNVGVIQIVITGLARFNGAAFG